MRQFIKFLLLILFWTYILNGFAQARSFPLWGDLKGGSFAVVYKTLFIYDGNRSSIMIGRESANGPPISDSKINNYSGRQMQVSIWYPAIPARRADYMNFEEYVFLRSLELDFNPLSEKAKLLSKKNFVATPLAHGASADKLETLMKVKTGAIKNADPAAGRFPLIVFAHSSPPQQSIMCEYLASFGFVVAAVPSKGSFGYDFDGCLHWYGNLPVGRKFSFDKYKISEG